MYHDQGLPVLKAASFGHGVNVTLGLPFIRTSVDHGTALDLAGDAAKARGADPGSLVAAVELAIELARGGAAAARDADRATAMRQATSRAQALRPELPRRSALHRAHRRRRRAAARATAWSRSARDSPR